MTLMKSILLGSAAGVVAVASAQAADLPTRKAAPVEYVRVCNVGGITGWTMPGSDTCVKISGYMTAHYIGGNLGNQYNSASSNTALVPIATALGDTTAGHLSQVLMVQGSNVAAPIFNGLTGKSLGVTLPAQGNGTFNRDSQGWNIRANLGFDFASNTAYGPLIGHMDFNSDLGSGLDSPRGSFTYVNTGYVTWAGITAGKAQSFYSFIGGGDNWNNFFSPDQKGFNEPILFAYTASFGGGFTATLAAQSQGTNGTSGGGTNMSGSYSAGGNNLGTGIFAPGVTGPTQFGGQRWPDIVGALHVKQGWGEAQVSGVIHNVNVVDSTYYGAAPGVTDCGTLVAVACNAGESKIGWGIDAGVKVNLPSFGAGDDAILTGSFTRNAAWYSGLPDAQNGENGQVNGNGQPMYMADAYFNPLTNSWATPTAWSVSTLIEHHWTPTFYTDFEGSIGGINWTGQNGSVLTPTGPMGTGLISPHAFTYLIGADIGWNPVTNLNFDLELMYQHVQQDAPSGNIGTVFSTGAFIPGAWQGDSSGFQGRLRITRYF
ncbi:MAG: porin [Hyphomicrobiales bacterium]|nr:porin [Hyphomicrobiales bacterium]